MTVASRETSQSVSTADSLVAGVEIADSATRFTLALGHGDTTRRWHARRVAPATPEEALDQIHTLLMQALTERQLTELAARTGVALGVTLPGQVDAKHGIVLSLGPLAEWRNIALSEHLTQKWRLPAQIDTTTNAAALAEARSGSAKGYTGALYVSLTRTITATFILDGQIWHGAHDFAGMLGHTLVNPNGPRCACGARGHLNPLASAQSLVRNYIGRASATDESTAAMHRASGGRAEAISASQIISLAAEGEPAAQEVVDAALDGLALALASAIALLDPAVVVIGGPFTEAGEAFLGPLRLRIDTLCATYTTTPSVVAGSLDPFAALIGATLLAGDGLAQ